MSTLAHWPGVFGRKAGGAPAAAPYRMEVFSYTGDGAGDRIFNFANTSLDPDFCYIKNMEANLWGYYRCTFLSPQYPTTPWHTGGQSEQLTWTNVRTNRITDMGLGFVEVQDQPETNSAGVSYSGFAFQTLPGASSGFNGGWYEGDDQPTRSITGLGFSPDVVWLFPKQSAFEVNYTRGSADSLPFTSGDPTPIVSSLDADGFTVSAANTSGAFYLYLCWKSTPGICGHVYPYAGDGISGATVPVDAGVTPDLVLHRQHELPRTESYWRSTANADGVCSRFRNLSPIADRILRFNSGNYEVSGNAEVNSSGINYAGQWWTEQTG